MPRSLYLPAPGPVPPESCGALVEKYGIIPGPTTKWGTATEEVRKAYREAGKPTTWPLACMYPFFGVACMHAL